MQKLFYQIKMGVFFHFDSVFWLFVSIKGGGGCFCNYTNSLMNADLFYAHLTNTTIQNVPTPHITCTMKQNFFHKRRSFWYLCLLIPLNLLNVIFSSHNFYQEPKVALTKELVYLWYVFNDICIGANINWCHHVKWKEFN